MKLFLLEPEVAGGFGENSVLIYEDKRIKEVKHLHYEFEGWLGDDLLTTSPCFIVTESLANTIISSKLTGVRFDEVEVSQSDIFKELYTNKDLPSFKRLVPLGSVELEQGRVIKWIGQDFCLENRVDLVVTENALEVIKKHALQNCDITELILG